MEVSFKSLTLIGSVLLTGLSAGLFYAWSVSVIPGMLKASDSTYLESMQSINRAILNPAFFLIFFGSAFFLGLACIWEFHIHKSVFWIMIAALFCYIVGTLGVTIFGNVPLNNQLDALHLNELTPEKIAKFRSHFESNWNQFNLIRTVFAVVSFILSLLALFIETEKITQ